MVTMTMYDDGDDGEGWWRFVNVDDANMMAARSGDDVR